MQNNNLERTRISNEEKLELMKEYIQKTGKKITASTKYNGYNIGYMQNNLRQMYFNGQLKIDDNLLKEFMKYEIIIENKVKSRSDYQDKYNFLMSMIDKNEDEKLESQMKNGLSYKKVVYQIQTDYNRGKLYLEDYQIEDLRSAGFLEHSKNEKENISKEYKMPYNFVIDILKKYGSKETFIKKYKQGLCNYDFKGKIFCGFRGITISSRDITEYQKLNYSLFVKDIINEKDMSFEYGTNKYINIDEIDNLLAKYKTKEQEIIRMYYGLDGTSYNFKEIESKFELARGRSGQIRKKILNELSKQDVNLIVHDTQKDINELNTDKENYEILSEKLKRLANFDNTDLSDKNNLEEYLNDITLEDLEFSVRTYNCLKRAGKNSLFDILDYTPSTLIECRNLGKRGYDEIIETLNGYGVRLKNDDEETNPFINKKITIKKNNRPSKEFLLQNHEIEINNFKLKLIQLMKKINITNNKIVSYNLAVETYLKEEDIFEKNFIIPSSINYSNGNIFDEKDISKIENECNTAEKMKIEKENKEQEKLYKMSLDSMKRFILEFAKIFNNIELENIIQDTYYYNWIVEHSDDINKFDKIVKHKSKLTMQTKELLKKYNKEVKSFCECMSYLQKFMYMKMMEFNDYIIESFRKSNYKTVKEYGYHKTRDGILMFNFKISKRNFATVIDTNIELTGWHINLYVYDYSYNFSELKSKTLDILNEHGISLLQNSQSFYVGEQHLNLYSFDFNTPIEKIYNKNIELIQIFSN